MTGPRKITPDTLQKIKEVWQRDPGRNRYEIAAECDCGHGTVQRARWVWESGNSQVITDMESGDVSPGAASNLVRRGPKKSTKVRKSHKSKNSDLMDLEEERKLNRAQARISFVMDTFRRIGTGEIGDPKELVDNFPSTQWDKVDPYLEDVISWVTTFRDTRRANGYVS